MNRGLAQFWYQFRNRFLRREPGLGEPLTFLCGSEEELLRLTTWACHVNTNLFADTKEIKVRYCSMLHSREHKEPGCIVYGLNKVSRSSWETWELLVKWGTLIHKYNRFTGTEWCRNTSLNVIRLKGNIIPIGKFAEKHAWHYITVHPPSAHEGAEALLALSEWLDGKVSEQEKRELLQLPDDVQV